MKWPGGQWGLLHCPPSASATAARTAASRVWISITGDDEGDNEFGQGTMTIHNYASAVGHKHAMTLSGRTENVVIAKSCRWESSDPIRKISLTPQNGPNFKPGSILELSVEG